MLIYDKKTNAENLQQYKTRFSLVIERAVEWFSL